MTSILLQDLSAPLYGATPNQIVASSPEFYVSYNSVDSGIYGSDTTAVVVGQMQRFYVLCGDHRTPLADLSFDACLDYLHAHAAELNRHSDPLPPRGVAVSAILGELG